MHRYQPLVFALLLTFYFYQSACTAPKAEKKPADSVLADSTEIQKRKLTQIYTQAIQAFIEAVYKKDKISYDTLYFGKHVYGQDDDFPDITLPDKIEKTYIRLVVPEVGQTITKGKSKSIFINLMGWIEQDQADFMFVVFKNGAEHQHDYFIQYTSKAPTKPFVLNKIEFENYLDYTGQKPKRVLIYKDGNYVADK